jgi:ferredoxin-NADP reductase
VTDPAADNEPLPPLPHLPPLPRIGPASRRPPPTGARREWQGATVLEVRVETARMKTFRLGLSAPMRHVAGQHVVVRLTASDGYSASRSYSIASAPGDGSELEIMVDRLPDGEVSVFLHDEVEVGDRLEVRGSFGGWFVWSGQTPALLLGGGSGVVPLMAMLRHSRNLAAARPGNPGAPVRLLVSVRAPHELPFAREYGAETTLVYTRETPAGWPRPAGRLDAADLRPLLMPAATAYVCGSTGFADHASELLVELGHPVDAIRVERYGPT